MDNLKAAGLIVISYLSNLIFFDRSDNNDDKDSDEEIECICTD